VGSPERLNCEDIRTILSDYLNLDLPNEACREVENHLAGCAPCDEFAENLRATVELCRRYRPAELPAPMGDEARARLLAAYGRMLATRVTHGS
jgi:anti-sigma factor RsiW